MSRCDCCDLPVESCGREAERRQRAEERERRAALVSVAGTVAARYGGRCAACGEGYGEGEPIRHSDRAGGWVAGCCL